jgi:hypothetical protein
VSSNGFLSFTSNDQGCCEGDVVGGGDASAPNNLVAGYWTDLYPPSNQGISYGTTGTAGSRVFTTAFDDIQYFGARGDASRTATFSISLFEGSNRILINYNGLTGNLGGYNVSAGIEDFTGTDGLQLFRNSSNIIDPAFSNRAFLISGAVPEPGTWAMLLLGFGVLGGAMRQRKAATRIAYA